MTRHKPVNEFHALATGIGSGIGTANQALSLTIYTRSSLFLLGLNWKGCEAVPTAIILPPCKPENKANPCGKKSGDNDTHILSLAGCRGVGICPCPQFMAFCSQYKFWLT